MSDTSNSFLIILIVFSILFIVNPNWFYLEIGGSDQWAGLMYIERFDSFFNDKSGILGARTSRFGWLIPGQFFINNFGEIGAVLFPVVYFLLTILTYFFLLNLFFNINLSLFLSLFSLTYMELHGSYGWLYMSNYSATYLIISIYFFFKGLNKNNIIYYFVSGVFSAISILTYSTSILFFVLFPFVLFLNNQKNFIKFLLSGIIFLFGFFCLIILVITYFYLRYDIFLISSHFLTFQIPFIFSSFDYSLYFSLKWIDMLANGWSSPNLLNYLMMAPSYALCLFAAVCSVYLLIKERFFLEYFKTEENRTVYLFCFYVLANHSFQVFYGLLTYFFSQNAFLYPKHHFFLVLGLSTILSLSAIFYLLKKETFEKSFDYKNKFLFLLFPLSLVFFYYNNDLIDNFKFSGNRYFYVVLVCVVFYLILIKKRFQSVAYLLIFLIFMNFQASSGNPTMGKSISYYNYDRCSNRKDLFLITFGITKYLNSRINQISNYRDFIGRYSFVFDQEDKLKIAGNAFCSNIYKIHEKIQHPVYSLWYYKKPLMSIGESVQYYFENKFSEPHNWKIFNYWHTTWEQHKSLSTLLKQQENVKNHEIVLISSEDKTNELLNLLKNETKYNFVELSKKNFIRKNISVNVLIFSFKKK
jgi:hypothetical protein